MIRVYSTFTWQFFERGDNGFNYEFGTQSEFRLVIKDLT